MHLLQRIAISILSFSMPVSFTYFTAFSPFFFVISFLVCAAYGLFAYIGHSHPSIHPSSTIHSHRIALVHLIVRCTFFFGLFFMLFYRVFSMLRFLSPSSFSSLPASTSSVSSSTSILAGFLSYTWLTHERRTRTRRRS